MKIGEIERIGEREIPMPAFVHGAVPAPSRPPANIVRRAEVVPLSKREPKESQGTHTIGPPITAAGRAATGSCFFHEKREGEKRLLLLKWRLLWLLAHRQCHQIVGRAECTDRVYNSGKGKCVFLSSLSPSFSAAVQRGTSSKICPMPIRQTT